MKPGTSQYAFQPPVAAVGPLRSFENQPAPCRIPGQRVGRPHRAACSRAQMPLWRTMKLARPPGLARVPLQHARILPASRCSHPPRPHEGQDRVAGKPGLRHPENQDPASRQAQPGGGDFWGAEERTARVGARSALRCHSGRGCPNAAPAGRVVRSAARPVRDNERCGEAHNCAKRLLCRSQHHRAVGAFSARPLQYEPPPGCACRDARHRQRRGCGTAQAAFPSQGTSAMGRYAKIPVMRSSGAA